MARTIWLVMFLNSYRMTMNMFLNPKTASLWVVLSIGIDCERAVHGLILERLPEQQIGICGAPSYWSMILTLPGRSIQLERTASAVLLLLMSPSLKRLTRPHLHPQSLSQKCRQLTGCRWHTFLQA